MNTILKGVLPLLLIKHCIPMCLIFLMRSDFKVSCFVEDI